MALTQVKTTGLADDAVTGAKIADDTVAEANMANDAISLTELKAGTDGQIITWDASGNPTAVGPGTDGQVLTSTGAGSPPAFESISASGIASLVADTSPQLGGDLDTNSFEISLDDDHKVKFGASDDLYIWHNSSTGNSNITNINGNLYLQGNNGSGTAQNQIAIISNAAVELNYQGSKKFETTSSGVTVTGSVNMGSGDILGSGNLDLEDNGKIKLGTGDDLQIYHDGSTNIIDGQFHPIELRHQSEVHIKCVDDGAVELYNNNSKKFETYANGCTVTGNLNASNVDLGDDAQARFGTDNDASIKHSGSDFLISNGTGSFDIKCTSGTGAGEGALKFHIGSGTEALSINNSGGLNHTSGTDNMITSSIAGAIRMQLTHTGGGDVNWANPSSGSAAYSTSSDYRLKQNVVDLPNAWSTVKALKPYEYKWKHNTSKTSQGFFAHEVIATAPNSHAGQGEKDAVDEDDKPIYQQIDYSKLVPVLTKALQEAITEIETLKTKVAALEAE